MDPRDDVEALMAVRVQGVAPLDRFTLAIGVSVDAARERAAGLVRECLAVDRSGRVSGLSLTADGNDALDVALKGESLRGDEALTQCYERFLRLNERLLAVASDWQVRRHGPIEQPNDHQDPDYDQSVIDRLCDLHDAAVACLRRMTRSSPRFGLYRARLDKCLDRLRSGEMTAFTGVMQESYHTVWFELHQDLLLTLGLEREA